jgi:hypothetical protein
VRLSQPAICSGDHCRRRPIDTVRLKTGWQASLQSFGRRARSHAANAFLPGFIAHYNTRFAKASARDKDLHRVLDPGQDLDNVLCWREQRNPSQRISFLAVLTRKKIRCRMDRGQRKTVGC